MSKFNSKRLSEIFGMGEAASLEDIYEIEDVAMCMKQMDEKLTFYDLLKKKKKRDIDLEVNSLKEKKKFLKKVILKTLEENNKKSLNFPGSCKIKTSKGQITWTIKEEEDLLKFLKEKNEIERCVEEVTEHKIIKKEVNKFLDTCDAIGEIPDCVTKEDPGSRISITYIEENEEDIGSVPVKTKEEKVNYDELDF